MKAKKKDKPKYNAWQNFAWMVGIAWREKEKKVLLIEGGAIVCRVTTNLTELFVVPVILGAVEARVSFGQLLAIILGFVGLMMLNAALNGYLNANGQFGKNTVRSAVTAMLNRNAATTSYPNLYDATFSKLIARALDAVNDSYVATVNVWKNMRELIQYGVLFLVTTLLLTNVHPLLLAAVLITSLINYFLNKHLITIARRYLNDFSIQEKKLDYLRTTATDNTAAKDIRIFGLRPWLQELHSKAITAFEALVKKDSGLYLWTSIADVVSTFLQNGIAYAYLLHLVLTGSLSASEFLLYFTAVGTFSSGIDHILNTRVALDRASLYLSSAREALEFPEIFRFEDGEPVPKEASYEIRLEKVSFRYPDTEHYVLKDIDLTLHPGEKIAIVGLNGAGKTSLVHLICGFLDPTEGRVLLNGKDIRLLNRREYYDLFSAVFQQFIVLPGTIAMNVAQSEDDINMDRVKDCIRKAGLEEKVKSEPAGYDTLLERKVYENAIMLSGGETQRLMLARALYKDAPIVILDEPTAALDPLAEADMYNKYHAMTAGKSSLYISHRLASTRFCDRILLIEQGSITEEGTHKQLLAQGGSYAKLFEIQQSYYAEGGADRGE